MQTQQVNLNFCITAIERKKETVINSTCLGNNLEATLRLRIKHALSL